MQVGLFIPCFIDQFYPQVGMATVEVLQRTGVDLEFPSTQTCCGQPMANSGCSKEAASLARRFFEIFSDFEYVVAPSGSCVAMVRHHYHEYLDGTPGFEHVRRNTFELCEFLTDVLGIDSWEGEFPYRVGLHESCHGLRELRMGRSSELVSDSFSKPRRLLGMLDGVSFSELNRPDECCGFGGTFAVAEEAVSCMMGMDRLADHEQAGTEVLTAADMSCLMHLEGLLRRNKKQMRIMHIAEILAGDANVPG